MASSKKLYGCQSQVRFGLEVINHDGDRLSDRPGLSLCHPGDVGVLPLGWLSWREKMEKNIDIEK